MTPLPPPAITAPAPAQVTNQFQFRLDAPPAAVAPLFGAQGERAWAGPEWQPEFVYPQPAADVEGAVFTLRHGAHVATWVNTQFDLKNGRTRYVYVVPDIMVASIAVALTPAAGNGTIVTVTYQRTALRAEANAMIAAMGAKDAASGPEWKAQIEGAWGERRR